RWKKLLQMEKFLKASARGSEKTPELLGRSWQVQCAHRNKVPLSQHSLRLGLSVSGTHFQHSAHSARSPATGCSVIERVPTPEQSRTDVITKGGTWGHDRQ